MSPSFGLHHVRVEKCRIAGRLRLVVRHVGYEVAATCTTERPQSRGKPTSVSSVDDDAFAPKAAVRATAVEPSVQPFEGRSVSRGIHKREFLIRL
jgi:hypothetical protein